MKQRWVRLLAGLLVVLACGVMVSELASKSLSGRKRPRGQVREYWLSADPVTWNVMPTGVDALSGEEAKGPTTFETVVLRAYTPNWEEPLPDDPNIIGDNDGIPGPTLRAKVGDVLKVHFRNNDTLLNRPHSLHAHGVAYGIESDGSFIAGEPPLKRGGAVPVGGTYTYTWVASKRSVGTWPYHDHSVHVTDNMMRGLFGAIIVSDAKKRPPDREFVIFLHTFDPTVGIGNPITGGLMQVINGRAYLGNTPIPIARVGERVRWHVIGMGSEFHTFHIHGHRWRSAKIFTDHVIIFPGGAITAEFVEDAEPGAWPYHCHVEVHIDNGMVGAYLVEPGSRQHLSQSVTIERLRRYRSLCRACKGLYAAAQVKLARGRRMACCSTPETKKGVIQDERSNK